MSSPSTQSSYVLPSVPSTPAGSSPTEEHDHDDIASLPSDSDGTSSTMSGPIMSDAEREWRESLQQLELLLTMVLVPYMGKYFGRKAAYWGKFLIFWLNCLD
jgi:hypothetical protein